MIRKIKYKPKKRYKLKSERKTVDSHRRKRVFESKVEIVHIPNLQKSQLLETDSGLFVVDEFVDRNHTPAATYSAIRTSLHSVVGCYDVSGSCDSKAILVWENFILVI